MSTYAMYATYAKVEFVRIRTYSSENRIPRICVLEHCVMEVPWKLAMLTRTRGQVHKFRRSLVIAKETVRLLHHIEIRVLH